MERPELAGLEIADPPERWEALGFTVSEGVCPVGALSLRLGGPGHGIAAWSIRHLAPIADIDGLATAPAAPAAPTGPGGPTAPRPEVRHANRATGIDHVVVLTPAFERTAAALEQAGMPLRRIREAGEYRQGFRRLGPAILELVEAKDAPDGPARFWGVVVIVEDLDALAQRLGAQLGPVRDAVQPGRRIATLRSSAGLGQAVAFMTPAE